MADDHKLFRRLVLTHLSLLFDVVGEAENGEQLLSLLERCETNIVLLDLNMPKVSGLEALEVIKKRYKSIRVIVLSMHDAESYIVKSIESGACSFIHKNAELEEIQVAIESVYKEGFYINSMTQKALLSKVGRNNLLPIFHSDNISLSSTELNVLKYLCQEFTSQEIAEKVYLSPRSVEGVRQKLIKKANVKNMVGLVLFAIKNGLVSL